MAYSSVITYPSKYAGHLVIRIVENEAGTNDESGPAKVPMRGRIIRIDVELLSGTGTTVDPCAGRKPGWTDDTGDEVYADSPLAPAAHISEAVDIPYFSPDGEIRVRSQVDAGADNVIVTELVIAPEVV